MGSDDAKLVTHTSAFRKKWAHIPGLFKNTDHAQPNHTVIQNAYELVHCFLPMSNISNLCIVREKNHLTGCNLLMVCEIQFSKL